jgi:hypothetical protein
MGNINKVDIGIFILVCVGLLVNFYTGYVNWKEVGIFLLVCVFFIVLLYLVTTDHTSIDKLENSFLIKFLTGLKNGFLFLLFFLIGLVVVYSSSEEIYKDYRLKNDSISVSGEIQSSEHFKKREGRRLRKRTVEGYKIDVKFYDSGVEKIKTFEVKSNIKEGTKIKLRHVPDTNISSIGGETQGLGIWGIVGGLVMMVIGIIFGLQLFPNRKY